MISSYTRDFWRFAFVPLQVAAAAKTAIEYPPMLKDASFYPEAVRHHIKADVQAHNGL